ncbi:dienelactone hydrolase family protein [Frankia sp. AgB32]|uniref:alpha/beta hydrolase family protein n=1 Tax=Frankia sp. AgB32 TaxID=631119 RepID=UPI0020105DE7|nr:dienelactone hydrolase family protein [Frankia sp. AgB32]MCK9894834.1 dienelactone hydrolase family protein [Frankia sp. AgB32]
MLGSAAWRGVARHGIATSRRWRRATTVVLPLMVVGLVQPWAGTAPGGPAGTDGKVPAASAGVGPTADPPQPGPWAVGYRTVRIADPRRPGRQLITSLWYPAQAGAVAGPATSLLPRTIDLPGTAGAGRPQGVARPIPLAAPIPAVGSAGRVGVAAGGSCPEVAGGERGRAGQPAFYPLVGDVGFDSDVAVTDAPPAPGPFPLVVFSHGSAGSRVQAAYLMEALASHGYVVAAPDHPGDTMVDVAAGRAEPQLAMAVDRSRDLSAVIDALTDPSCAVRPRIRPDQIAAVGFSFGGLTAIVSSVGLLAAPPDPRVRVSVGIAAATAPLPAAFLARIRVPTLLLAGTRDPVVTLDDNAGRAFRELSSSRPRVSATVTDATHNSFTEICRQDGLLGAARIPPVLRLRVALTAAVTCRPPLLAAPAAHVVADRTVVAFLDWQVRGDAASQRYLAVGGQRVGPGVVLRVQR